MAMIDDPLIIVAKNSALPDATEEKNNCLEVLTSALADVFVDFRVYPDGFSVYDGHLYSQVELSCPDCGTAMTPIHISPGPENGASAAIQCSCGFEGRAVYRLVDIERNTDYDTVEEMFETGSTVADDESAVAYTPYATTDTHSIE